MVIERRKHHFVPYGYDSVDCSWCGISTYATQTEYCDEVPGESQLKLQKMLDDGVRKEVALEKCRQVLDKNEWALIGLDRVQPYRNIDRIKV